GREVGRPRRQEEVLDHAEQSGKSNRISRATRPAATAGGPTRATRPRPAPGRARRGGAGLRRAGARGPRRPRDAGAARADHSAELPAAPFALEPDRDGRTAPARGRSVPTSAAEVFARLDRGG